jgi:uncharacterized protein with HEPN domain
MARDAKAYIWDAMEAAKAILVFVEGLDANSFQDSDLVRSATERKFVVIGEALNQLTKINPELSERIPDRAKIVAFRNQLTHGYANVNPLTVWNIVRNSLPPLIKVLQGLLGETD